MPIDFKPEAEAIRKLRAKHPAMPAKTLAKRIETRDFKDTDLEIANGASSRGFFAIYSVIRRYDAKQKKLAAAA